MNNLTLSITQLNNYIKNIFDNEELLFGVSVYGEVTNFKISNGVAYFEIKEEGAQLSCVKFSAYDTLVKNGDQVLVTGKLNYHIKLGRLSFVVSKIEPYGMGELYKRYLELKSKLEDEGLFDQTKKVQIPKYSYNIGVVTSETGAVIRDIYHVTKSKNPYTNILVYPAKVQGVNAENEIVAGIEYFNKNNNVDVIIVARGGGSFEDLSPFNTEIVARATFESKLPIISAVGHETDFSIIDFVADLRAPTPSVAAELAVFNYHEELESITSIKQLLLKKLDKLLDSNKLKVSSCSQLIIKNVDNKVSLFKKEIETFYKSTENKIEKLLDNKKTLLSTIVTKLEKSNPLSILQQGYSKVLKDGKSVAFKDLCVGDKIETIFKGGRVYSIIDNVQEAK